MSTSISNHYASAGNLAGLIADRLQAAGKDLDNLNSTDLASIDEFHIRGREATLELIDWMRPKRGQQVLDIGSGLARAATPGLPYRVLLAIDDNAGSAAIPRALPVGMNSWPAPVTWLDPKSHNRKARRYRLLTRYAANGQRRAEC